ncbi:Lrp/AsnC family transcriptional regulator [Candidatus Bathyarchaeota archaeon]|jgi:DNA-binding Lrp family transcriptional regulator|nr:Lrp/AsnC family transcriptional regulator [Candidatus Bathyarchaeota archaeon]
MEAFILVKQKPGTGNILDELLEHEQIEEAYPVYGIYDIILMVKAEDQQGLNKVVNYTIRRRQEIETTMTMIIT